MFFSEIIETRIGPIHGGSINSLSRRVTLVKHAKSGLARGRKISQVFI